jgi:hypothetical protein
VRKYSEFKPFALDLQNRITNAELFVATTEQTGQTGAQVGQESMPAVFLHALKLKMKADQLYKIGEKVDADAAFAKAKLLLDLLVVDEANKQALIDILLDTPAKVAAVGARRRRPRQPVRPRRPAPPEPPLLDVPGGVGAEGTRAHVRGALLSRARVRPQGAIDLLSFAPSKSGRPVRGRTAPRWTNSRPPRP